MDAPAVLGDDARRDGQPQAGTSILGRKMRQKKLVFVFGRNAIAGIRDGNFHGLSVGKRLCGNSDLAERRILQCFGSIVDEIHDHAAQQSAVGAHGGKILGESCFEGDAIQASCEYLQCFADNCVRVCRHKLRGREAHELGEFIYECGERGNFPFDQPRTFLDQICQLRVFRRGSVRNLPALEESRKPLGRELYWGERILNLMRHSRRKRSKTGETIAATNL